jgi:chorismate mutase
VLLQIALLVGAAKVAGSETTDPLRSLVEMSAERLLIAEKVAYAKWDHGVVVEDAPREASVLQTALQAARKRGLLERHPTLALRPGTQMVGH